MMNFLKNTVLWAVAISLLNSSIDVIDEVRTNNSEANPSIEEHFEIESITEFLMQETNNTSLPDNKENDQQGIIKKGISFCFSIAERKEKTITSQNKESKSWLYIRNQDIKLPKGFILVDTPPPDQAAYLF